MLLAKAENLRKSFDEKLVLDIGRLEIYSTDKIGIVGANGSGKTTLLRLINGEMQPDAGSVRTYGRLSFVPQLEQSDNDEADPRMLSLYGVIDMEQEHMSGGEKTRLKIAQALSSGAHAIFADEPTSNLDKAGIKLLVNQLKHFSGALVIISHDRYVLDELCEKIWEICDAGLKEYVGNYSCYIEQKQAERARHEFEYDSYIMEKDRLLAARDAKKKAADDITKKPGHVSYSEYNCKPWKSTRTFQSKQKSMNRTVKAIESRISALEVKDKPEADRQMNFYIPDRLKLNSKYAVMGSGISKSYNERIIFDNADFNIKTSSKTVIMGNNGAGKTTLMKMIVDHVPGIIISPKARIGYFDQDLSQLQEELSVFENVMPESIYNQTQVRALLAQMLFTGNDLNKKASVLSGGERIRLLLTKLFASEFNILLLDEPTNYLDIKSIEAFENAVRDYKGTIVLVSHDERLVNNVADSILLIENQKIRQIK